MAVKYSKQRDFGAKGRKSLKVGKKMMTKKSTHRLKSTAKKRANAWRKKGYSAAVKKTTGGWLVLTHTK
tara:strand:- start:3025 stop:3231 length:207 start_codon:yes stop_codon:yes gene_type:complete